MPQSGLSQQNKPAWDADKEMFGLRTGRVIAVNWQDHTVDLAVSGGATFAHVPIASRFAGTDYGDLWQPQIDPTTGRACHAIIAFLNGMAISPMVIGFFYPEVSQMMLDGFQRITRYAGDTFTAVSLDGDIWLAFNPDGSYVGFHNDNPAPPIVHGVDYDKLSNPATGKPHSFTAVLRDGTSFHMDGPTGNVTCIAGQHLHQEAKGQLDLVGRVITLTGLPAIYPGGDAAVTSAPSTVDAAITVAHLTTNAAYNYQPPVMGTGPGGEGILTGWTYLTHGAASRVEMALDGVVRYFKAPAGFVGAPIAWEEVTPSVGGSVTVTEEDNDPVLNPITKFIFPDESIEQDGGDPEAVHIKRWKYLIPPEQPDTVAWSTSGNYDQPWLCGPTPDGPIVFTDHTLSSGASGTLVLKKNGSTVPLPTTGDPLSVEEGDILTFSLSGITALGVIWMLTIWGRRAYADTTNFRVVDLEAGPPPTVVDQ